MPCETMTTNAGRSSFSLPEPVGEPRADAGPAGDLESGLEKRHRRIVIDRLGVHAT